MKLFDLFRRKPTLTANMNSSPLDMFRDNLERNLAERRAIRMAQGRRVKHGISAAQRRRWQNDPLRQ